LTGVIWERALAGVRIVLVEPAGPLNVGASARVMKNLGLQQLVLVNPQCDPLSAEAKLMAVHAVDILEAANVVATLPEALQGCQRAIATTARVRTLSAVLEHPRTALPWLITPNQAAALIFGPEYRGLANEELNYAQRFVRIPSSQSYSSLNLAQAVAICCYELSAFAQDGNFSADTTATRPSASLDVLEGYYQQLEALLLNIGYLYPHTAASRMEKFRQIFNRAQLDSAEVTMLRGILTQIKWALFQSLKRD
jgi:tRNA/rRNA methyltransferase